MAIRDRLEKKTRRFGKGIRPPSKPLGARANRFADFVGEYFYPLINGIDMPREHLDLQVSMPSIPVDMCLSIWVRRVCVATGRRFCL